MPFIVTYRNEDGRWYSEGDKCWSTLKTDAQRHVTREAAQAVADAINELRRANPPDEISSSATVKEIDVND